MLRILLLLSYITLLVSGAEENKLKEGVLERMVQPKVSLDSGYVSDANVNGSDGSVAVTKNRVQINNAIASISYTNWHFNWSDVASLPFGDGVSQPIEQMHSIRASINIPYFINEEWFWLTSISARSSFEREMEESYGAGIFSFASYKLSDDHSIQMGAFANYHPVSTIALPVMSYSYRARKTDGFQLILGFPRAYMGYFLNEKTLLRAGMIFSQSVIKLAKESSIEAGGFVEAEDYMSNIGVVYEFNEKFRLEADVLYSIKRNFIIYDASGNEQQFNSIDPSFGANIRLRYLF